MKKKGLEISSFYTSVPKNMIICFTVPEIWHVIHVIIFHFGLPFAFSPPNCPKNQNFKKIKKKKKAWSIIILHMCTKNWLDDARFPRYGARRMDGRMKKVTYRGGCSPKKRTVERMLKWYIPHKLEVIRFYKMTKYDSKWNFYLILVAMAILMLLKKLDNTFTFKSNYIYRNMTEGSEKHKHVKFTKDEKLVGKSFSSGFRG